MTLGSFSTKLPTSGSSNICLNFNLPKITKSRYNVHAFQVNNINVNKCRVDKLYLATSI